MSSQPPIELVVDDHPAALRSLSIAIVTETWPPEVNGVSLTISRIVEGLVASGHELQVVRPRQQLAEEPDQDPRLQQVLVRGLPIPSYPHLRIGLPSKQALLRLWRRKRPDIVHIATEGPLGWSAMQAALVLKLPVSSDFRTNFHAYSRHYGLGWLGKPILAYLRMFHNRTLATMVPTPALRGELARAGFRNLHVVGRGVDTVLFAPERRSTALRAGWGVSDDDLVVACVGRLAPEKNLDLALRALAAIRRHRPDARLLLVGDGPLRRELQARCPDAIFAGMRRGDDLASHYASADMLLFPSLTETFGNVTIEALASGLPLVAFDMAGAAQLVRSGQTGLLATPGDERAFIDHALRVATSRVFAAHLGRHARSTALLHGWDAIVDEVEDVMRGAIQRATLDCALVRWPAAKSAAI